MFLNRPYHVMHVRITSMVDINVWKLQKGMNKKRPERDIFARNFPEMLLRRQLIKVSVALEAKMYHFWGSERRNIFWTFPTDVQGITHLQNTRAGAEETFLICTGGQNYYLSKSSSNLQTLNAPPPPGVKIQRCSGQSKDISMLVARWKPCVTALMAKRTQTCQMNENPQKQTNAFNCNYVFFEPKWITSKFTWTKLVFP